jgi:Lon-like protease
VKIALDDRIGGPSAGLMFALGILDKLGPTDLTGGRFIAGTGTIDVTGDVGPIGGIPLKLIAARDKGATAFLVPSGNCAEASRNPPAGLDLIKVDTLSGAVNALGALRAGKPAPHC